jgi:two-component system, cell cycle response regulator DivK
VAADRTPVLVADADEGIRSLVALTLDGDSFEVAQAAEAGEALTSVALHRPALILVDEGLPGASGTDIARSLKAQPETGHAQVVLLFDRAAPPDQDAARAAGVDAFLAKPFNAFTLLKKVDELRGGDVAVRTTDAEA